VAALPRVEASGALVASIVGAMGRIVAAAVAAAIGLPHCGQKPAVGGTWLPHLAHVGFEGRPSMD
jgi:hypothetical protein